MRQSFGYWRWLLPLLLFTGALAARGLNADWLYLDEYWSIRNSGGAYFGPLDPLAIWQTMARVDPGGMGIVYHWLLAGWFGLVGSSIFALRAFSWLAGFAAIASAYRLGHALGGRWLGGYAAVLLGSGAFFIDFMHEGRAYTLLMALTSLTLWAYWHIRRARHSPGLGAYLALLAGVAALAYTHYVALAVGAAIGLYHLAQWPHMARARWIKTLLALVGGALLFLPWLEVTLGVVERGAGETTRQVTAMNAPQILEALGYTLTNANLALGALLLVWGAGKLRQASYRFSAVALGIVLLLILLVNAAIPFMVHPRYLLVLFPLAALLLAGGLRALEEQTLPYSAAAVLVVWVAAGWLQALNPAFMRGVFGHIERAPAAGLDAALARLRGYSQPADVLIFHSATPGYEPYQYFPLEYYMHSVPGRAEQFERMNNSFARGDNAYLSDVLAAFGNAPRLWTIVVPTLPTTNLTEVTRYALNTYAADCGRLLDRPDVQLGLYARPPTTPPPISFRAPEAPIGLHVVLSPHWEDQQVTLALGWSAPLELPARYSVGVHLLDAAGQLVAQADHGLPERRPFACTSYTLPAAAPAPLTLVALVYDWQTGERLPVQAAALLSQGAVLGEFSGGKPPTQ